ncbi:MAG: Competence protein [Candidatus Ozemobacter sibiricus]|uniref:Competence protein n=1 Tax=Candidatus Ozemobacter sibiricus TaxID=2268124 RepID=A0A367ZRV8_9BACT|nr:MAG: Competence protein [Candidatus Ozemobacter sibiricus]
MPRLPADASRPEILPLFVALFVLGTQAGLAWEGSWGPLFVAMVGAGLGLSLLLRLRGWGAWAPLVLLAVGVGGLNGAWRAPRAVPLEAVQRFDRSAAVLEGVFVDEFRFLKRGGLSFVMEQARLHVASQAVELPGRVRCQVQSDEIRPEPGQWYQASGTFLAPEGRDLPLFRCEEIAPVGTMVAPGRWLGWLQQMMRERVATLMPPRQQTVMLAFLLGDSSTLAPADRRLFRVTGVSHLMAVSGQHVLVLACSLAAVLTWIGVPPLSRAGLVLAALLVYGGLTVGQPSVWRAIAMYLAAVTAVHLEASPGPVRPVALTALILLLLRPGWLLHIGFLLSFAAVLGIVLGRRAIEKPLVRWGVPVPLARYLAVSVAANLGTAPLVARHYGTVSLASFVANPLLVWMFAIILPVGMALPLLGAFLESTGLLVASGLALILDLFFWVLERCAALPLAQIEVGEIPGTAVAVLYAAMLVFLTPRTFWGSHDESGAAADEGGASRAVSVGKDGAAVAAWSGRAWVEPGARPGLRATDGLERQPGGHVAAGDGRVARPSPASPPEEAVPNPFDIPDLVEAIDQQLAVFPKRSLKGGGHLEAITFPVRQLTVEGQTLFHRLDDLGAEVLCQQPDRLLQAQIYALALLGGELMARVVPRLRPVPTPAELTPKTKVRNRYLAMAMLADAFFHSPLPARTDEPRVVQAVAEAQAVFLAGRRRLYRYLTHRTPADVADFLDGRQQVLAWLRATGDLAPSLEPRRSSSGPVPPPR